MLTHVINQVSANTSLFEQTAVVGLQLVVYTSTGNTRRTIGYRDDGLVTESSIKPARVLVDRIVVWEGSSEGLLVLWK